MSKIRAIEVAKNLSSTIEKLKTQKNRVVKISNNDMVHDPKASLPALKKKLKDILNKYNLKLENYGITKNEG